MTIYLAGSGPHIVQLPMAANTGIDTGNQDTAWAVTCIFVGNTANVVDLIPFTAFDEGWFHCEVYQISTAAVVRPMVLLKNSSGVGRVRVVGGTAGELDFQYYNGSAWVSLGTWAFSTGRHQLDIFVKAKTDGEFRAYWNKVAVAGGTGDFSAFGEITNCSLGHPRGFASDAARFSQILIADFPTLFAKVKQSIFTGVGALTAWTGSLSNITENVPDVSTFIYTSTAGAKNTYTAAARSLTGYEVKGVITQFSGLRGGASAPNSARAIVRISGTDYNGPTQTLAYGNQSYQNQFLTNPATGLAWTPAEAGAATLEFGVEALNV